MGLLSLRGVAVTAEVTEAEGDNDLDRDLSLLRLRRVDLEYKIGYYKSLQSLLRTRYEQAINTWTVTSLFNSCRLTWNKDWYLLSSVFGCGFFS